MVHGPFPWRCLVAGAIVAATAAAQADVRELLARLPDDCIAVVHADAAERAVAAITATLAPLPEGLPPEVTGLVGAGLLTLRSSLGGTVEDTAALLASGGVAIGASANESRGELVMVARPRDGAAALQWCRRFESRIAAALDGDLLLVSSSAAGLARLQQSSSGGRWRAFDFGVASPGTVLRGAVDLARLRELRGASRLEAAAQFLGLPLVHALEHAAYLTFDVTADRALSIGGRADATVLGSERAALLAGGSRERSLVPLAEDGLALVSLDRSLRALFDGAERFLDPTARQALQGFLSIADALDGPRSSFVDDLLGGLAEPFALHVLPASAGGDDARAPLVLPEFAVVAGVANPDVQAVLFRFLQVFTTIANAERMQRGQGAFRLRRLTDESGTGFVAEPPPFDGPGLPPVDRQLTPTVWCGRGLVVLASTETAARRIVASASAAATSPVRGDVLELRGPALAALLRANRGPLELARRFDEGEDESAAHRFFDVVLAVANAMQSVVSTVEVDADATRFRIVVTRQR